MPGPNEPHAPWAVGLATRSWAWGGPHCLLIKGWTLGPSPGFTLPSLKGKLCGPGPIPRLPRLDLLIWKREKEQRPPRTYQDWKKYSLKHVAQCLAWHAAGAQEMCLFLLGI